MKDLRPEIIIISRQVLAICLDLGHLLGFVPLAWICAILLEFELFCLDLGYIAWIWAIRIWVRNGPKGEEAM